MSIYPKFFDCSSATLAITDFKKYWVEPKWEFIVLLWASVAELTTPSTKGLEWSSAGAFVLSRLTEPCWIWKILYLEEAFGTVDANAELIVAVVVEPT